MVKPKILLASGSPRRLELLTLAGFEVEVHNDRKLEEVYPSSLPVDEVPSFLSQLKALGYSDIADQRQLPLVAADTIVVLDGEVIGKPHSETEAIEMLSRLSGKWHDVISGVTLLTGSNRVTFSELTRVKFANLSSDFIEHYVKKYRPLDKAGSYGVQEWIGIVGVERIEGDFYNIMGFPVQRFMREYFLLHPFSFEK